MLIVVIEEHGIDDHIVGTVVVEAGKGTEGPVAKTVQPFHMESLAVTAGLKGAGTEEGI